MPRKPCYWTRSLEFKLVEFIKHRDFMWKPVGNTNHDIQKKYKAYAEFASLLDGGFTARSVRDRWVNIRSTFNHYLRRTEKSKMNKSTYVPCWPLWKPLQFLCDGSMQDSTDINSYETMPDPSTFHIKTEETDIEDNISTIRQQTKRTDRPRRKIQNRQNIQNTERKRSSKCKRILDDLIVAMKPVTETGLSNDFQDKPYWFFGKHVTAQLNSMLEVNAECARNEIMRILNEWPKECNEESIYVEVPPK